MPGAFLFVGIWPLFLQAEAETVQPKHESFLNNPLIEGARLERAADEWRIVLDLRFVNVCQAEAGALAEFLDLPLRGTDEQASLRVVLLRQRVNPEGCPDIFMPVTVPRVLAMNPSSTIQTIVLLNTSSEFSAGPRDQRIRTIDVASAVPATEGNAAPRIRAAEKTREDYYPTLQNVSVSIVREGGRKRRYDVEFDAIAPSACHLAKGAVVLIHESPAMGPEEESGTVHDWLFVYSPGAGRCADRPANRVQKHFRVASEVSLEQQRRLVIVNRVEGGKETRTQPFTVLDIR